MKVYKNLIELIEDHKDVVYPDGNTDVVLNERAVLVAIRTVAKVYKTTNGEYICDPIINRYYVVEVLTRRITRVALFPSQTVLQMQEGSQSVGMVRLMYSLMMVMNTGVSNL